MAIKDGKLQTTRRLE